jgi:hypothetical protein
VPADLPFVGIAEDLVEQGHEDSMMACRGPAVAR